MARLDLLDPAMLADPYPALHRLRAEDPVHWEPEPGYWAVSRYDDALDVLRDPERFSSAIHRGSRAAERGIVTVGWFAFLDAPAHTRLRSLVGVAFTPEVVEGLRSRIAAIVTELLDA